MSQSRKEIHNNNDPPKPMDTLDLHGCTKSEAISQTTDFLERSSKLMNPENAWVLIITGTGAHSLHGPVLRGAVEALLTKRKIEYYMMKGKGSFLVNAASGFALYDPAQPIDSKVIVAPTSSLVCTKGQRSIQNSTRGKELSESRKVLKKIFHDRCREEAAFDEAVSESLKENARVKAEDKQLIERGVSLSLLDKEKEAEEENKLNEAIEISKRESIVNGLDEDEQIRKALALSQTEFDQQRDPDAYLQHVMELSRKEINESRNNKLEHGDDREDDGLLKALELSVVDF